MNLALGLELEDNSLSTAPRRMTPELESMCAIIPAGQICPHLPNSKKVVQTLGASFPRPLVNRTNLLAVQKSHFRRDTSGQTRFFQKASHNCAGLFMEEEIMKHLIGETNSNEQKICLGRKKWKEIAFLSIQSINTSPVQTEWTWGFDFL